MGITPQVFKFDTGPFNWYLIKENSRFTLVDAGFPGHYKVLVEGLKSIGHTVNDIEAIILTHAHADHTGFAEKVRKLTNAPVYVHSKDAVMASSVLQLPWFGLLSNAWRPYTATMLGVAIINGVFTFPSISKTVSVNHNDVLDVPGKPRILHTPGHTDGEIALYLESRNVLISGDTIVTRNLLTGEVGLPQITNPILTNDYKQANNSLDLLREIKNVTLLPGHGTLWHGDMTEAIKIAREKLKKYAIMTITDIFKGQFEPELLKELDQCPQTELPAGTILRQPENKRALFTPLVLEGLIRVTRVDTLSGKEIFMYNISAGESCFLTITASAAHSFGNVEGLRAVTETVTKVVSIDDAQIRQWNDKYKTWRYFISKMYNNRFTEFFSMVDAIAFKSLDSRLVDILNSLSEQQNPIEITHSELANHLGTAREVISRLLKRLESDGRIRLGNKHIEILSL